jgi:hypothetical protein
MSKGKPFMNPHHRAFGASLGGLFFFVGILATYAFWLNQGHWIYPLDDTYIHLSIARHLAEFGNWGVRADVFASASSSPLYTLLLGSMIGLFGNQAIWAFLLNLLAAAGLLYWWRNRFAEWGLKPKHALGLSVGLWLLTPLPWLILVSMETVLQIWIGFAFLWQAVRYHSDEPRYYAWKLFFLALLTSAVRYEGWFLIVAAGLILGWEGRFKRVALMAGGGLASTLGFGLYSLSQGGTFVPLSVLIKSHKPGFSVVEWLQWLQSALTRVYENAFILILLLLLVAMLLREVQQDRGLRNPAGRFGLAVLIALGLHIMASDIAGARYASYLVALGFFALFFFLRQHPLSFRFQEMKPLARFWLLLLISLIALPFLLRMGYFTSHYPRATHNIYEQQFQMARFLQKHYPEGRIAANDIGAITYFNEIQLTDLVAIGDQEIAQLRRTGQYTPEKVGLIWEQRQPEMAVVHDVWVGFLIPPDWHRAGSWTIDNNFICADPTVTFYAPDSLTAAELGRKLEAFSRP